MYFFAIVIALSGTGTAEAADTLVEGAVHTNSDSIFAPWGPYWINTTTAIIVFIDSSNDLSYTRTTNGGVAWTTTEIVVGSVANLAVWFDQETPGNSGNLLHIATLDFKRRDNAFYQTLDISTETLGTQRTVDNTVAVRNKESLQQVAITRTRSGNIIYCFSTADEIECYRSTDLFATAGIDVADAYETVGEFDHMLLFPANTGDNDDACAIFIDISADEYSIKMFDNSVPSWTETSIDSTGINASISIVNLDGAIRHSDSHLLIAYHTDTTGSHDFRTRDITVDSIASPTITTKTNIITAQTSHSFSGVFINQQNDDVYVVYEKGATFTAVDTVYHISADGMTNWGTEQTYSEEAADDHRTLHTGRTVGNNGGFFQPVWYDDDQTEIAVNLVNDVPIAAVSAKRRTFIVTGVPRYNFKRNFILTGALRRVKIK